MCTYHSDGSDAATPKAEAGQAPATDKPADDFSSVARSMAENARQGSRDLQCLTSAEREKILFKRLYTVTAFYVSNWNVVAELIDTRRDAIMAANDRDMEAAAAA